MAVDVSEGMGVHVLTERGWRNYRRAMAAERPRELLVRGARRDLSAMDEGVVNCTAHVRRHRVSC
ncbi:hypothetical protein BC629DRAFT_1542739 [Irpex lacteus]|nr:hypothetical protein BC629DRAFT_1542739 [Irpex lacteus]